MRAVVFDSKGLRVEGHMPRPEVPDDWARIHVSLAGICGTDMEIMDGYAGYDGVLGHEFVGSVEACSQREWVDTRVAGEINAACGTCEWCRKGLYRHCSRRKVLGIRGLDGCMADFCVLPASNLIPLPAGMPDRRAVFVEPLSAACRVLEQFRVDKGSRSRALVLGDGKLGILCAWVLSTVLDDVTLLGHHPEKLEMAAWRNIKRLLEVPSGAGRRADLVIEATGTPGGIKEALRLCRPGGTVVLKSTVAVHREIDLSSVVVDEISLVGSRCGRFKDGIQMIEKYKDMPLETLITETYPLEEACRAFSRAAAPDSLKVLLDTRMKPKNEKQKT